MDFANFLLQRLKLSGKASKSKSEGLIQLFRFKSENFMTINASSQNQFKPVQYVKARLGISPLLCMVTTDLTKKQPVLFHSPFPQFIL
jgi:hypothetical protein